MLINVTEAIYNKMQDNFGGEDEDGINLIFWGILHSCTDYDEGGYKFKPGFSFNLTEDVLANSRLNALDGPGGPTFERSLAFVRKHDAINLFKTKIL